MNPSIAYYFRVVLRSHRKRWEKSIKSINNKGTTERYRFANQYRSISSFWNLDQESIILIGADAWPIDAACF